MSGVVASKNGRHYEESRYCEQLRRCEHIANVGIDGECAPHKDCRSDIGLFRIASPKPQPNDGTHQRHDP